jgi:hypothetical protein
MALERPLQARPHALMETAEFQAHLHGSHARMRCASLMQLHYAPRIAVPLPQDVTSRRGKTQDKQTRLLSALSNNGRGEGSQNALPQPLLNEAEERPTCRCNVRARTSWMSR